MKVIDLKNPYPVPSGLHERVRSTLNGLDEGQPVRFQRRSHIRRVVAAAAVLTVLAAFSTAAYATGFFGLLSERVGKYGLNLRLATGDTAALPDVNKKPVKLKLGYIPAGCMPMNEGGKYSYCTGGVWEDAELTFTFWIIDDAQFNEENIYIVDVEEHEFNGHKVVVTAQQTEEDGAKSYSAVEYFEDWGYVVECHCNDRDELIKIMKHLDLEEDTEYAEPETYALEQYHDAIDEYTSLGLKENYHFVEIGESFGYSSLKYNENGTEPDRYTIQVVSAEKRDSFDGLDKNSFIYQHLFSEYFDNNNKLITPYNRTDWEFGDGVNELNRHWETKADRHFILVTVAVKANYAFNDSVDIDAWSRTIAKTADGGYDYPDSYGLSDLVYRSNSDQADTVWEKGETHTFVYGIMVDDEVYDKSCLFFRSLQNNIDHSKETVEQIEDYACILLKGAVER